MMGTLGELLFYIASQAADRGPGCPWHIPPASLAAAVGLLAPGQDEIAQVPKPPTSYASSPQLHILTSVMLAPFGTGLIRA